MIVAAWVWVPLTQVIGTFPLESYLFDLQMKNSLVLHLISSSSDFIDVSSTLILINRQEYRQYTIPKMYNPGLQGPIVFQQLYLINGSSKHIIFLPFYIFLALTTRNM